MPPEPIYSTLSLHDLDAIEDYYTYEIQDPGRGAQVVEEMQDAIESCSSFPLFGIPLRHISDHDLCYRYWRISG